MAFSGSDFGISNISNFNFLVNKSYLNTAKTEKEETSSTAEVSQQEEELVLSDNFSSDFEQLKAQAKSFQEAINYTETAKSGISQVQDEFKQLKKDLEQANKDGNYDAFNKILEEGLDKISKITDKTSFNGQNPLKEANNNFEKFSDEVEKNTSVSIKDLSNLVQKTGVNDLAKASANNKADADAILKKLEDMNNKTKAVANSIGNKKQEIITAVSNKIEINFDEVVEETEFSVDNTKESIKKDAIAHPQKSINYHIKNLSPKIILAMISMQK